MTYEIYKKSEQEIQRDSHSVINDKPHKRVILDADGNPASVQYPLPTDGDSVYAKDIWVAESDSTNWSGTVTDLVDNLHSTITNTTSDDPKTLLIHFNRTLVCNAVGLGANTGDFSNVKIYIVNSGDAETLVYNGENDNTKLTNATYQLPVTAGFNALKFEFHTTDAVSLSNLVALKTTSVVARIDAVKPDNTVTDINATAGGNLKVALEEFDDSFNIRPLPVTNTSLPTTGFGEVNTATNQAFIQAVASYNLIPANFREFTSGTGTTGAVNKMFQITTGTGVGGYGAIQSFRALNYKAGEAGLARFTALFQANAASSWQGVGLLNLGDELSFGYNGTSFGIWHRYGGLAEVRTITVTGAAGGSETLALTLNTIQYDIPITSGTVEHNAYEIADWLNTNQSVWAADQVDDTVIISAVSDGAKGGTYTYSSSTSTGTFAQDTAGVTKTSDFVAQASWNGDDILDGNGTSGITIDPSKGNVYQIAYQYLGFGDIRFYVENPTTGDFLLVHTIRYANSNTSPSLGNPSMRLGMYAVSLGSTTDLTVNVGSFAAFVQGEEGRTRNPRAVENTQNISTTFENLVTIRNRRTYNGIINQVEVTPDFLVVSSESSKNVEVEVRATTDPNVEQNFTAAGTNLVTDVDKSSFTATNGRLLTAFTIAPGASTSIDLNKFRIRLPPSLQFIIQAKTTGGAASDVSAALTYYEDL